VPLWNLRHGSSRMPWKEWDLPWNPTVRSQKKLLEPTSMNASQYQRKDPAKSGPLMPNGMLFSILLRDSETTIAAETRITTGKDNGAWSPAQVFPTDIVDTTFLFPNTHLHRRPRFFLRILLTRPFCFRTHIYIAGPGFSYGYC